MLRLAPLDATRDLTTFRSGRTELDLWLRDHARPASAQGTRTYLLLDDSDVVVGYFAIAPHLLRRDDLPRRFGRGAPKEIPAMLLAKFALSLSLQGRGLGSELLLLALRRIVGVARAAGGKLIIVDAIDDKAAAFYRHHDFASLPGRGDRMLMKMSTAARALGIDWP